MKYFLVLAVSTFLLSCKTKVDKIIHHAKIYTVDSLFTIAEAVAINDGKIVDGMIAAVRISRAMGRMSSTDTEQGESTIRAIGTLPPLGGLKVKSVLEAIQHDKKVRDGVVHFVLPVAIGQVEITRQVPLELVRETVKTLIDESKTRRTR